jgi:hypothetical protein
VGGPVEPLDAPCPGRLATDRDEGDEGDEEQAAVRVPSANRIDATPPMAPRRRRLSDPVIIVKDLLGSRARTGPTPSYAVVSDIGRTKWANPTS